MSVREIFGHQFADIFEAATAGHGSQDYRDPEACGAPHRKWEQPTPALGSSICNLRG